MSEMSSINSQKKMLLSGNEAIAHGAWQAGCSFGSGYPGTPSSEILPALTKLGDAYTEWAVNEKCALEAASGASLTGARCLVTMKHVGLNVASDPLFTLAYTGVSGGIVIVSADDPAMHSSQNEQDNRHYARAAKVPLLEPADSQEAMDFTSLAFELSERFDTPIILRVTTRVCHSESPVIISAERRTSVPVSVPQPQPGKYVMIPAYARRRRQLLQQRLAAVQAWNENSAVNCLIEGSREIGIIAAGVAYQYAREAAPHASFLKLGMTWPLPEQLIRSFAQTVRKLYVIEELEPFLSESIRALGLHVETLSESLYEGELNPLRVDAALRGGDYIFKQEEADLPLRPPQLCPGCPHRGVFHILQRLKLFVTGDIGCYTLGTLPPLQALHTCLCMGAGVGQLHGLQQVCGTKQPAVAVIGDSTFLHSGVTGLLNIVYNQSASVVIILDNGTTAMTGGQDHPGTGRTLSGRPGKRINLEALCRGIGVDFIRTVNPRDLASTEKAIRDALAYTGPAVIIAHAPCVLQQRPENKAYQLDESLCVQCAACLRLGCPAISVFHTENEKRQPQIDPVLCAGCSLCAQICPKKAIRMSEAYNPPNSA